MADMRINGRLRGLLSEDARGLASTAPVPTVTTGLLGQMLADSPTMQAAAAQAPQAGMSWSDFAKQLELVGAGASGGTLAGGMQNRGPDNLLDALGQRLGIQGTQQVQFGATGINEGGDTSYSASGYAITPELMQALSGYRFQQADGTHPTVTVYDPSGKSLGNYAYGDAGSSFDRNVLPALTTAVIAAGGLGALGTGMGWIPGAEGAAAAGAADGAATAGLSGAQAASEAAAQLGAWSAANPVTAAEVASFIPSAEAIGSAGALGSIGAGEAASQLAQWSAANPVTAAEMQAAIPSFNVPIIAPATFNAAADSQAASQQLGITGQQSAAASAAPSTVNLSNAGGTMATSGGLQGLFDSAAQGVLDTTASPEIGGSALSQAGSAVGDALGTVADSVAPVQGGLSGMTQWLKDNPTLGRLLFAGASGLLNTMGQSSGSQGGAGLLNVGPAKQWNSQIQRGILNPVQQVQTPQLPSTGLLAANGYDNAGAWRFLKG